MPKKVLQYLSLVRLCCAKVVERVEEENIVQNCSDDVQRCGLDGVVLSPDPADFVLELEPLGADAAAIEAGLIFREVVKEVIFGQMNNHLSVSIGGFFLEIEIKIE